MASAYRTARNRYPNLVVCQNSLMSSLIVYRNVRRSVAVQQAKGRKQGMRNCLKGQGFVVSAVVRSTHCRPVPAVIHHQRKPGSHLHAAGVASAGIQWIGVVEVELSTLLQSSCSYEDGFSRLKCGPWLRTIYCN